MESPTLTSLAEKYRSDKASAFVERSFTHYYDELFSGKQNKIKKVLEIGIGDGASLRMWRDFFHNATIYGADYMASRLIKEERIETFLCDQRRGDHLFNLIKQIGYDIDLVVEDGSHRPRDQVYSCLTLMPLLKKDVIYIIENVFDLSIVNKFLRYEVEIPKLVPIKRFDSNLVVVRNKPGVNISFFAKKPFRVGSDKHLSRVSSIIRGYQIAGQIGAKLNPIEGYEKDICIYVKPPYKSGSNLKFEEKSYLDIVDSIGLCELAIKHPEVSVISLSKWNQKVLKKLIPNKVVNIPQHHCNFERVRRNSTEVKKVGIIGAKKAFDYLPKGLKDSLARRGVSLLTFSEFSTRQDIVNFYMNIDVQIVWRPYYNYSKNILANPLKIVNAASFGIPTIAYDEKAFLEMKGCYIPVHTLQEFLDELDKLRTRPMLYEKYSKTCIKKSEKYHIEKIAKMYTKLT
jgi:hypothetical protein